MSRRTLDAVRYHGPDIFPRGTPHHAVEIGSVAALQEAERAQRQAQGLPPHVVLEQRDELLQCVPLHVAAERGHMAVAQHIVRHEVDVDAADGHQVRPLHLAAINDQAALVRLLVSKGANVTKTDSEGDMPSHWAATKGHVEMLEMLLDCGAPVDAHNNHGWTCLHRAAFNGRVQACAAVVRRGASMHAVTKAGCTPLHLAAANNQLGVMELLLQLGASTHFRDQQGATAADMCISAAARGLLAEKEAAAAARSSSRATSATAAAAAGRPASTSSATAAAAAQPAAADITHVAAMPRFRRTANDNLDADGFPSTAADDARGLRAEASDTPQTLLVDAAAAQQQDGDTVELCDLRGSPNEPTWADQALAAGQLSRQASKQQHTGGLSAASSFNLKSAVGGASLDATKLARASASPRARQGAGNARFLARYSLDKKGLFGP